VNGLSGRGAKRQKIETGHEGYTRHQQAKALEAAEKRAIRGIRPAGVDLAKEAEELSEEERIMDDERVCACPSARDYTALLERVRHCWPLSWC
jgi:hypothetical protein